MEAVMRNGVVGGLLCLVGLQSQVNCQVNWKNSKVSCKLSGNLKLLLPPVDMDRLNLVKNINQRPNQCVCYPNTLLYMVLDHLLAKKCHNFGQKL